MKASTRALLVDLEHVIVAAFNDAAQNEEPDRAARMRRLLERIACELSAPAKCECGHLATKHNAGGRCHARTSNAWCECAELRPA